MKKLRILEANESGHGILIEMDAGYVSPREDMNAAFLREAVKMDYKNPFEFLMIIFLISVAEITETSFGGIYSLIS
jgi:hypothetical protein